MPLHELKQAFIDRFKSIMNYQYYDHSYGESHFLNVYKKTSGNENKEPTEYQDETLKAWMKVEPWVLREYVLRQKKLGETFCLYTNQINLEERRRSDTSQEFPGSAVVFPEERYLFAIANDGKPNRQLHIRFWADGILVCDIYQRRRRYMDYLYIPCSMITDDSYLEIEIFPEYSYQETVTFHSIDDTKEITLPDPEDTIFPTSADLHGTQTVLYAETGLASVEHFDRSMFKVTAHYDRGDFDVTTVDESKPVRYTRLKKFTIGLDKTAVELVDNPVDITIKKMPRFFGYEVEQEGYQYIKFTEEEVHWNFDVRYLRVFVNGRLIPRNHYVFEDQYANPRLFFLDKYNVGDIIYIDITPYQYNEIYYKKDVGTHSPLLVDLRGVINKPFDPRYYDVYMNGRRLSMNNIFAISPYEIALVNLTSSKNFVIYEKERDYEWYGLDYTNKIYYYTIDELFSELWIRDGDILRLVNEIIAKLKDNRLTVRANTDEEEPYPYEIDKREASIQQLLFYYNELIPKGYSDGDELQFNAKHIRDAYRWVHKIYSRHPADYAEDVEARIRKEKYPDALELDADILVEGDDPIEERTNAILVIGYLDEVPEDQLNFRRTVDYNVRITSDNEYLYGMDNLRDLEDGLGVMSFQNPSDVLIDATTSTRGLVQLSNDIIGTEENAATPKALSDMNATLMHTVEDEEIGGNKNFSDGITIGGMNLSFSNGELVIS